MVRVHLSPPQRGETPRRKNDFVILSHPPDVGIPIGMGLRPKPREERNMLGRGIAPPAGTLKTE